jgi:hypothetical protein
VFLWHIHTREAGIQRFDDLKIRKLQVNLQNVKFFVRISPLPCPSPQGEGISPLDGSIFRTVGADLRVCPKQSETPAGADLQSVPFDTPVTNRRERNVAGTHPSLLLLFPSPCGEGQGERSNLQILKFSNSKL